ncbi:MULTISPECIES: hypothetical protein [Snodgrassella]|nr:hypothetical protein [Snodgrassella sp. ESL0323]
MYEIIKNAKQKKTATSVPAKGNIDYAQQIYASLREYGYLYSKRE